MLPTSSTQLSPTFAVEYPMGKSKLYTKKGDEGETQLASGERVPKDDVRVQAYGEVDELCAVLGLLSSAVDSAEELQWIERKLFTIEAILANPDYDPETASPRERILPEDLRRLEMWIDALDAQLPKLTRFILPGGGQKAALAHLARCVCRRAERAVVALRRSTPQSAGILPFLNRLSDYLFVLARSLTEKGEEVLWE